MLRRDCQIVQINNLLFTHITNHSSILDFMVPVDIVLLAHRLFDGCADTVLLFRVLVFYRLGKGLGFTVGLWV